MAVILIKGIVIEMEKLNTPGSRLKYIREKILQLPRAVLSAKYGMVSPQIYSWEVGRLKVNMKVLNQYQVVFDGEGVVVDRNWVLEGDGAEPYKVSHGVLHSSVNTGINSSGLAYSVLVQKELSTFLDLHSPHGVCIVVDSDLMNPFYYKGDYVCGVLVRSPKEIAQLIGMDCIVFSEMGQAVVRRISNINEDGTLTLTCHSPYPGEATPNLYNFKASAAARIILQRKE